MEKKQLKFQYKNTPQAAGVYQIKNTINAKVFVGSSLNLNGRRNRFDFEQKNGFLGNNREMHRDWEQHGPDSFSFEILEQLKVSDDPQHDYRDELAALEKKWLKSLKPYGERGYNSPKKAE